MPEISIIVPVYNTEKYICRCVDSILCQTFTDFELLLVDDGSPDYCGVICDEYAAKDNRIRVFHQENQGQAVARNNALDWLFANSNSKYISFVDSDDWVHPRFLELLLYGIQKFNVSISQCAHIETDGVVTCTEQYEEFICVSPKEEYINYYSAFFWEKLFKRQVWKGFRFPEGQIYEDLAIWYKVLFSQKSIAITKTTLYYYFMNLNSTVHKDWTPARLARMNAWDEQIAFFNNKGDKELIKTAVRHYCKIAYIEFFAILQSNSLSREEKEEYKKDIENRICKLLTTYKTQQIQLLKSLKPENRWCLEVAHPIIAGICWKIRGLFVK